MKNILKWLYDYFDPKYCYPPQPTSKVKMEDDANSLKILLADANQELSYLKSDLLHVVQLIINDYRIVNEEIVSAIANKVPVGELQINLGERHALSRALINLHSLQDVRKIIDEALHLKLSIAPAKIDTSVSITRESIKIWLIEKIYSQTGLEYEVIVNEASSFFDDLGMDSLDLVEILIAIETEYNIYIENEAAVFIITVGQAIDCILKECNVAKINIL